jgi:hypothetical protein
MIATTVKLISGFVLVVAASACATTGISDEETLANAGAVRLSSSQVKERVTGKTEQWVHGGAYYQPDGKIRVKWRKTYTNGSWEVADDGNLCFKLPHWEKRCQFYMNKDGDVYMLDEGRNIGVRPIADGDKLASVGSFNAGEARTR